MMEFEFHECTTAELVQMVENYFNAEVYRDFIWSCPERGEQYFDTALREWAINLLDNEIGIDQIVKDGFLEA